MTIDLRKLLKDTIRGAIVDYDIPPAPITLDAHGEVVECSREELELFFQLMDEVAAELGEQRPSILRELTKLRREYGCSP